MLFNISVYGLDDKLGLVLFSSILSRNDIHQTANDNFAVRSLLLQSSLSDIQLPSTFFKPSSVLLKKELLLRFNFFFCSIHLKVLVHVFVDLLVYNQMAE